MNNHIDKLLKERCSGGVSLNKVELAEQILNIRFPDSYRNFLLTYGTLRSDAVEIMGLGVTFDSPLSLVNAYNVFHFTYPDTVQALLPIRVVSANVIHCLICSEQNGDGVFVFDMSSATLLSKLNKHFNEYLENCILEKFYREKGLQRLEWHVRKFENDYLKIGKVPRNHIWRPYRFCSQDVVLGLLVVKHSLENNCLEVDVCLTSDIPEYEPFSGARMTTAFLLSEAYKCGGSMEVRFTENVEGKTVPSDIVAFADSLEVPLNHVEEGRISPNESRQLFVALTGFASPLISHINELYKQGRLSQERICYVVAKGLWTIPEVETIVFGSQYPDSIFGGDVLPEQRHLFMHDLVHSRAAIMGGLLDLKLARRERVDGESAIDLEDDSRVLDIQFDPTIYGKIYHSNEELTIPWNEQITDRNKIVNPEELLIVLLRPRSREDMRNSCLSDINFAAEHCSKLGQVFVLVPRDFEQLQESDKTPLIDAARAQGVGILVCPETVFSLDATAKARLSNSRILRE